MVIDPNPTHPDEQDNHDNLFDQALAHDVELLEQLASEMMAQEEDDGTRDDAW